MSKVKALELDTAAAGYTGTDPVHFGGFPGMWAPDRPIALAELGFDTERDARDAVKELGLPLREVMADPADARMPERPNHALNEEQAAVLVRELDETPKRPSHKELDQIALDADVVFPDDVTTVDQKVAFLEAAAAGAPGEAT